MQREYIVSLNRGVDYNQFWEQIENASDDDGFVPTRRVDIINERPGSLRSCHYSLTESEAEQLRADPRVYDVEIPPEQRDDIVMVKDASRNDAFTKTSSDTGSYVNWGLRRCIAESNIYSTYDDVVTNGAQGYTYNLDGTGVDIVIQDSGLQVDHPEFTDADGNSRVQQIDWYTASGLPGSQSANHYRDFDGHGTHCAGIAAGKTYGWAKNARIYSVKVSGLEGTNDSGTGIAVSDCFDVIKLWHRNKPVDPATGYKRPTIVNMSWGYGTYFSNITGGRYRGTQWIGTTRDTSKGMVGTYYFLAGYRFGVRVSSVDVDIQEMIDEGIHICVAAGNTRQKIDVPGGEDYDNYFTSSSYGSLFYNRGGSPTDDEVISVGNIDSSINTSGGNLEQKAASSECGPGVDIWAPGTNIMSATSNTNSHAGGSYPLNENYKICNISGTSMASPQVCGVGALILQIQPNLTPAQLKTYLINNSKTSLLYDNGSDTTYTNERSLLGGNNRFLYNPLNQDKALQLNTGPNLSSNTYKLSVNKQKISQSNDSVTFTLATTNVPTGTQVPFTLYGNGVNYINEPSTGNFVVNNGASVVTFTTSTETLVDTVNNLHLQLDNGRASNGLLVSGETEYIATVDRSTVVEGQTFTVTVTGFNATDGVELYYYLPSSWVIPPDLSLTSTTGYFGTLVNNTMSKTFTVATDNITESDEAVYMSLRLGSTQGLTVANVPLVIILANNT